MRISIHASGVYPFDKSREGATESALEAIRFALACRGFIDVEVGLWVPMFPDAHPKSTDADSEPE
jgi:hypothetical protein